MIEIAIIGAGPYGLSVAAHFRHRGIPFRIFGRAMDSWLAHMPQGMMLKSEGFASNIYDPESQFTLREFCAGKNIEYSDAGLPVRLDTFSAYGLAFRDRLVPELEEKLVVGLERAAEGFVLQLEDGESVSCRRVVLAVGITNFEYTPPALSHLPAELLSHSFRQSALAGFKGRSVAVIGGGSSAIDLAGLLHEAGAQVQLIARQPVLNFHSRPPQNGARPMWKRIRHPQSGLGPGMRSYFFSNAPQAFYYLPQSLRLQAVRKTLGPAAGWFAKEKVIGRVPLSLGYTVEGAREQGGKVHLQLRSRAGEAREAVADHVIAATGYRVEIDRLPFVGSGIKSKLTTVEGTPVLSSSFESSVDGIYFVGLAAANSFGPVMRFAYGAGFAARTLTEAMLRVGSSKTVSIQAASAATAK